MLSYSLTTLSGHVPADFTCQKVKNEAGEEVSAGHGLPRPSLHGGLSENHFGSTPALQAFSNAFSCCCCWWLRGFWALVFALSVLGFDCVFLLSLAETDDSVLHS